MALTEAQGEASAFALPLHSAVGLELLTFIVATRMQICIAN